MTFIWNSLTGKVASLYWNNTDIQTWQQKIIMDVTIYVDCFDVSLWLQYHSGPRLNIKTVLSTYGDFHVKDKTAVRTSYL